MDQPTSAPYATSHESDAPGVQPERFPRSILVVAHPTCEHGRLGEFALAAGGPTTTVTCVASVDEARRATISASFECVLIDTALPEGPVVESVAIMRATLPGVPIVVLEGDRSSGSLHLAMAEGADGILPTSELTVEQVRGVLVDALRHRERRDADDTADGGGVVAALASTRCAAAVVDGSGTVIAVNDAWAAFAAANGATPADTGVGTNYLAVCERAAGADSAGADDAAAGLRAVLGGDQDQFVFDYPCSSQEVERWYSLRVTPAGDLGGGALVVHLDITDVKVAEQRLHGERLRPHHVLDRRAPILALLDADGVITELSEVTRQLFGVDDAALLGDVGWDWIEHDDTEHAADTFLEVLREPGATRRILIKALGVDGRWHDLDLTFTNLIDDQRIGAVVVAGSDVTDARNRQIREVLNQRLLQRLPAAVIVTDDRHVVTYWNDRAVQLYGHRTDDAIGRHIAELNVGPSGRAEAETVMAEVQRHGRWEGSYDARRADGSVIPVHVQLERVDDDEIGFHGIVGASIDISDRRRLEEDLEFQAQHDPLTGLPNRRCFITALEAALDADADGSATAVLFVDLDDFDAVNDRLGHQGGDEVICRAGTAIVGAVRPEDTVARIGGDEFVVCCSGLQDVEAGRAVGERILSAIAHPLEIAGRRLQVSASIGLARAGAGIGPEGLMRNADVAMYRAKESGRGRLAVFDDELHQQVRERQHVARQLESGLARNEIEAYFQPQFDLGTGELVGFEALARWNHPVRGLVGPGEFIPVAEATSLVGEVGHAVLLDACRALADWRGTAGPRTPTVSVNVSGVQLHDPDFPERVRAVVEGSGLPAHLLCLEVTESTLTDPGRAEAALERLKAVGVEIAIDDFGTGYSSFSRLHRFPVDYVKIDRSFVEAMAEENGSAIVSAVLEVSKALGFRCIAEGVETAEQRAELAAMGWDIAQGFLWSPAVPIADATEMVRSSLEGHRGELPSTVPR